MPQENLRLIPEYESGLMGDRGDHLTPSQHPPGRKETTQGGTDRADQLSTELWVIIPERQRRT